MNIHQLSFLLFLFSLVVFLVGCQNKGSQPSNPFAHNLQTVPPPATFSSQESYLGQTPGGSYVPQTPATTFPTSPTQSVTPLSDTTTSTNVSGEKATLFTAATAPAQETGWAPADVTPTSQTAFQAMDSRVTSSSPATTLGAPESLIVGTSHVVTTITDDSQPAATLTEPATLYSGRYAE